MCGEVSDTWMFSVVCVLQRAAANQTPAACERHMFEIRALARCCSYLCIVCLYVLSCAVLSCAVDAFVLWRHFSSYCLLACAYEGEKKPKKAKEYIHIHNLSTSWFTIIVFKIGAYRVRKRLWGRPPPPPKCCRRIRRLVPRGRRCGSKKTTCVPVNTKAGGSNTEKHGDEPYEKQRSVVDGSTLTVGRAIGTWSAKDDDTFSAKVDDQHELSYPISSN